MTNTQDIRFEPDLVLTNGKVVTVDRAFSLVEAVAVHDGKIVARGDSDGILSLAGPGTRRVDLKGRCVVPGQIDNHVHFLLAGLDALGAKSEQAKVNIATLQSIEEILEAIRRRAEVTPKGEWIGTSCMYRGALKEGRFPTREDLDRVAPEHPVYIFQSGKNIIVNSYALKLAGIDRSTEQPQDAPEGWIVKDDQGEPTGHLIAGAADRARKIWWEKASQPVKKWDFLYFDQDTQIAALAAQQEIYHACGIVGVREMGCSVDELEAFIEAYRRGVLKTRTDLILGLPARYMSQDEIATAIGSYFGPKQHLGDPMLGLSGIKIVLVNDGWWAHSPEKLRFMIGEYNRHGWNMAIHIGTGSGGEEPTELVISALEDADRERPIAGRRISLEHGLGLTNPDHIRRAKALELTIGSNTLLAYYASMRSLRMNEIMHQVRIAKVAAEDAWERTVQDWRMPIRDWLEAGLVVTGGSDNPAVVHDPDRPFLGQYAALTGDTLAGVLLPGQEITREQMLRMYTVDNAYGCWREHVTGSVETGKYADLAVLDRDILSCEAEEIKDIQVLQTYVAGELVHEKT